MREGGKEGGRRQEGGREGRRREGGRERRGREGHRKDVRKGHFNESKVGNKELR